MPLSMCLRYRSAVCVGLEASLTEQSEFTGRPGLLRAVIPCNSTRRSTRPSTDATFVPVIPVRVNMPQEQIKRVLGFALVPGSPGWPSAIMRRGCCGYVRKRFVAPSNRLSRWLRGVRHVRCR